MAVEHILALVTFIIVVLGLSLALPIGSRERARASDGGATGAWADNSSSDCGAGDGGGCDGGGD